MNKTLNTIEKQAEKYCNEINRKQLICDFEITDDNEADFYVLDERYMEDEDTFKEDIINIFKENGINPTNISWDYDCGDEYSRMCCLNITF